MKKLEEMTDAEKLTALRALEVGALEFGQGLIWLEAASLRPGIVYRILHRDPSVDWSQVAPHILAIAKDERGPIYAFGCVPETWDDDGQTSWGGVPHWRIGEGDRCVLSSFAPGFGIDGAWLLVRP